MALRSVCHFMLITALAGCACASSFLSRAQNADLKDLTTEMEVSILAEIEGMLGGDGVHTSKHRLTTIQDLLQTTFMSMPLNSQGKLGHAAVRYVLHSYFIQRHAWSVRGIGGLSASSESVTAVNEGSSNTLQDKVEEFVQTSFERRLGTDGLGLEDVALLAATYENLIHSETNKRLDSSYRLTGMMGKAQLDVTEVDRVLDVYMMGYIMNLNYTALWPAQIDFVVSKIDVIYPTWNVTRNFLRSIRTRSSFHQSFFSRADVEDMLGVIGDEYGRWQDKECQNLKTELVALEDKSIGYNGSGRVRLGDFYGSALNDGNWQFSENSEYLTQLGVLDSHNPDVPRVIIPNYINSPANCLASSKYYAVCCINECGTLMEHIEHHFARPSASPAEITKFIEQLPSATVSPDRSLNPLLYDRLEDIASHHGGLVPLHGRLFAQWMHHAYPRECPYPHISGTTNPQTPRDYDQQQKKPLVATKEEMFRVVQDGATTKSLEVDQSMSDDCTAWSHHEELYVGEHHVGEHLAPLQARGYWSLVRSGFYLIAAVSAVTVTARTVSQFKSALSSPAGKDVYV